MRFWEILSEPPLEKGQFPGSSCPRNVQFRGICLKESQPPKRPFAGQTAPLKPTFGRENVPLKRTFALIPWNFRDAPITYDIFRTFDSRFMLGRLVQAGGARPLRRERSSPSRTRDFKLLGTTPGTGRRPVYTFRATRSFRMAARIAVRSLGYSDPETAYKTAPLPSALLDKRGDAPRGKRVVELSARHGDRRLCHQSGSGIALGWRHRGNLRGCVA